MRYVASLITGIALLSGARHAQANVGATLPFTSYEAESGTLGGGASLVQLTGPPTDQYSSAALEASGHAYVHLSQTGQSVTWTNTTNQNITFINVRYSMPDAPGGGGQFSTIDLYVNGQFRQAIPVNSRQTWQYEGNGHYQSPTQNPSDGDPVNFWDDTHAFITGAPVAPGSTITLQKDSANSMSFYDIDVVDLENPPAPIPQPANSLSITDYGAVSDPNPTNGQADANAVDSYQAIQNCINAAEQQGKIVWIPQGTFYIFGTNGLTANGVTIEGAGMWYSKIYRNIPLPNSVGLGAEWQVTSCHLSNFANDTDQMSRNTVDGGSGGMDTAGTDWTANNMWNEHVESGIWGAGNGGTLSNCRMLSIFADGANMNTVSLGGGGGNNLSEFNNFVRGTGDDGIAINSTTELNNAHYYNNTVIAPWGGKCVAVYGGINSLVENNYGSDNNRYIGLGVMIFGSGGTALQSATVQNNVIVRGGGNGYNQAQSAIMCGNGGDGQNNGTVQNAVIKNNLAYDSVFDGMTFSTSNNITFSGNSIVGGWKNGIEIGNGGAFQANGGSATITGNNVVGVSGQPYINNGTGYNVTLSNNSWQVSGPPAPPMSLTATSGNYQIGLSWLLGVGATSYNIYRGTSPGGESSTPYATSSTPYFTDTATTVGTTYYYKVAAVNASGMSSMTNESSSAATSISSTLPITPFGATADVQATAGNVLVSWAGSAGATSYNVYIGTAPGAEGSTPYAAGIQNTWFLATGLSTSTIYYFKIAAVNSAGTTGLSNEASTQQVGSGPPSAPSGLSASAGNASVSLNWSGSTGANSYNVYRGTSSNGENGTPIATGITGTTYTDSGLTNGTTYYYKVAAVDSSGTSGMSNEANATPQGVTEGPYGGTPWAIPGTIQAENYDTGGEGVGYHDTDATNQGGQYRTADGVDIETTTDTGGGYDVGWNYAGEWMRYTVNVSTAGTYTVSFRVSNGNGTNGGFHLQDAAGTNLTGTVTVAPTGGWQTWSTVNATVTLPAGPQVLTLWDDGSNYNINYMTFTSNAGTPPSAPTLSGSAGNATVSLSWSASNGTSPITYSVYRGPSAGGEGTSPIASGLTGSPYTDSSVSNGTSYYYKVTAVNSAGSATSNEVGPLTPQPSLPASPTLNPASAGNATVSLSWSSVGGASTYNVYRGTSAGGESATPIKTGLTSTGYSDTGLTNGTTYYYKVAAVNSAGTSPLSNEQSATPTQGSTDVLDIACGNSAQSPYVADTDFSGGTVSGGTTHAIDTSAVGNPAPTAVYQHGRYGNYAYTIPNLTAGQSYTVRLHFCEYVRTAAGQRVFDVSINGTQVLTNFDIFAAAGAEYKANVQSFTVTANSSGQIVIATQSITDNAIISGIQIQSSGGGGTAPGAPSGLVATATGSNIGLTWSAGSGAASYNVYRGTSAGGEGSTPIGTSSTTSYTDSTAASGTTYYYTVKAVNSAGTSGASNEASAKIVSAVAQIDCGSPSAVSPFSADTDFSAGNEFSSGNSINLNGQSNPAPAAVYQTVRWNSSFNYTIPNLTAGSTYTVRLHFCELTWTASGQRVFNVAINGNAYLSNFDVFATAGGQNKALIEQTTATANSSGQIVISFTQGGVDNPEIAGIEVLH